MPLEENKVEAQLIDLHEQAKAIREKIKDAPDRIVIVHRLALDGIKSQLEEMIRDPSVQSRMMQLSAMKDQDIAVIDGYVASGLISKEKAEELLVEVLTHPDYRALRIYHSLGGQAIELSDVQQLESATGSQVDVDVVAPVSEISTDEVSNTVVDGCDDAESGAVIETLTPKQIVTYVIKDDGIDTALDDMEDAIFYPDTIYGEYKEMRVALLNAIYAIDEGESISSADLWELAFPNEPVDKDRFRIIRRWLESCEESLGLAEHILVHNKKRGPSSSFQRNPNIGISIVDKRSVPKAGIAAEIMPDLPVETTRDTEPQLPEAKKPVPEWEQRFTDTASHQLSVLVEMGLMFDAPTKARVVKIHATQLNIVTNGYLKEAIRLGLITQTENDPFDIELTNQDILALALFRKCPELRAAKSVQHQRRAIAILNQLISEFEAAKNEQ